MFKVKRVVAVILWVAAGMVYAGNTGQPSSGLTANQIALHDTNPQATLSVAGGRKPEQVQPAATLDSPEHTLPTLRQLRDCAARDAALTTQQEQLNIEEAVLRAEETRLAAGKRNIRALHSTGSKERLKRAERDWKHASAQLKKKIDDFDRLATPYYAGVFYQVEHCAFSQVRRLDLQQLCQEGAYQRFCAKYQAFQTDE